MVTARRLLLERESDRLTPRRRPYVTACHLCVSRLCVDMWDSVRRALGFLAVPTIVYVKLTLKFHPLKFHCNFTEMSTSLS